jgi:hypothetical protein
MELFLEWGLEAKESAEETLMGCIGLAERGVGFKGGYDMALENIFILLLFLLVLLFIMCA